VLAANDAANEHADLSGSGDFAMGQGEEFGLETLVMDERTLTRLGTYIRARMKQDEQRSAQTPKHVH
jgi:hypothetical protein